MENVDFFRNKSVLLFCPHQDDEINEAGGLLLELSKIDCKINVVYSTNGDYTFNSAVRRKEAIKALKILGVKSENVIFMGYPDQNPNENNHFYMSNDDWKILDEIRYTNTIKDDDYHLLKHGIHVPINKNNFINDIMSIVLDLKPDIIICVDYDSHCDHRALSLSFHHAMGMILKKDFSYRPFVFKCFAYSTSYKSFYDFKNDYLLPTRFKNEEYALYKYSNPYYDWNERISFDVSNSTNKKLLIGNRLFRAITKHISQAFVEKAYSVINSDQVFFNRRTDNLCLYSKITCSSGIEEYLNDFLYFDSSDIMNGDLKNPILDRGIFKFDDDDTKRCIKIQFDNQVDITNVRFYKSVNYNDNIKNVIVRTENNEKKYELNEKEYICFLDDLNFKGIMNIEFIFEKNIEITEIEIFDNTSFFELNILNEDNKNSKISVKNKIIFIIDDIFIKVLTLYCKVLRKFMRRR